MHNVLLWRKWRLTCIYNSNETALEALLVTLNKYHAYIQSLFKEGELSFKFLDPSMTVNKKAPRKFDFNKYCNPT